MAAKLDSDDLILCPCTSSRSNLSDFPELKNLLPEEYKYTVCNWKKDEANYFESRFRVNVTSEDEALEWFAKFSISSSTAFNPEAKRLKCKEAFIGAFRCRHNVQEEPRSFENETMRVCKETFCPTRLLMILKLSGFSKEHEVPDVHLSDFPMTIIYHQHHNHPVESAAAVRLHLAKTYKHPNPHIRSVLKDLDDINHVLQMKRLVDEELPLILDNPTRAAEMLDAYAPKAFRDVIASIYPKPATNDGFLLPREDDPSSYWIDPASMGEHLASLLPPVEQKSPDESTSDGFSPENEPVTYHYVKEGKAVDLGLPDRFKELILRAKTEDKAKTQIE